MSSRPSRGAARLAAILDALPDALLLVNSNGMVVNANAIALEAFETPGAALVGRGLLDLLPEFDSTRIPGSMRRPDDAAAVGEGRQRPTRMVARRTDGSEFLVEVTSANLEDGRTSYASAIDAAFMDHAPGSGNSYTGNELLMLVVRDLTGSVDTEAELTRQQRQTEMILRAASEGVIGVDTEGRIVLVNPAAAQILGYRASDLGGRELHPLVHHSRPDGNPLPYEETTLSDTLKSGRKHRVRAGQVLWAKDGQPVPVDLTTAPVRDGEQLVGAVVTFTDRRVYESLASRHEHLLAVLQDSLRGPLDQLRDELSGLAADPAGQLWPEANQILHHLAAGYARMTTLVDNVLSFQRLDAGREKLQREMISLESVVANGVEGAVELIGPGRAQFAVHAPPQIEAEVDGERMATALAHLIADVAGVDATGNAPAAAPGQDSTIVVAAAQRGDVVRIEVRGPHGGGNPAHEPIVRGIVQRHGGVLQTHELPGAGGSAYVLEVPVSADGAAAEAAPTPAQSNGSAGSPNGAGPRVRESRENNETTVMPAPADPGQGPNGQGAWTGTQQPQPQEQGPPTGRRRGRPSPAEAQQQQAETGAAVPQQASAARRSRRTLAAPGTDGSGEAVVQDAAVDPQQSGPGTGRRARRPAQGQPAAEAAGANGSSGVGGQGMSQAQPHPEESVARNGAQPQQSQPAPVPQAEQPEEPVVEHTVVAASPILGGGPLPQEPAQPQGLPMPGAPNFPDGGQSPYETGQHLVRTLGQGVAFTSGVHDQTGMIYYGNPGAPTAAPAQAPAAPTAIPSTPSTPGSGKRRRLSAPAEQEGQPQTQAQPQTQQPQGQTQAPAQGKARASAQAKATSAPPREFTIGAPAAGVAEGPEPLDGPNSPVEMSDGRGMAVAPQQVDNELPPEPMDNPRRLLVWPEPDGATQQVLASNGYRPVIVHSREEVDAQIAAYPAALFVDPLTGPITRTALQSLRTAAVAAGVPVLVTAGLLQATRDMAYGADPAVLMKALAPRDSEQHPPRVLLVEERAPIAGALGASLERRGVQVAHAPNDAEAVNVAAQARPNLVVMDLMQVHRRRAGIIDWLRMNGLLQRTPFVIYTTAGINPAELPRLMSGETVLFLAERSTRDEVQQRIVDLLTRISAN